MELGTYMRMFALVLANTLVAILLDQACAFTSLDQPFMFLALERAGTPQQVLRLVRRLYAQNHMEVGVGKAEPMIIQITHGIKQGCSASASICAICFEPVLRALWVAMGASPCRVLSFADDVGLALSRVAEQLRRLRSLFEILERAVSLALNGTKTKVIAMNAEAAAAARRESRLADSPLSGMGIVSSARYLCFMVMAEGIEAWEALVANLESRIQWIKMLGGFMVSSVRRINKCCMSILRYWAHLLPVPRELVQRERAWHSKVLGIPHNSMSAGVVSLAKGKRCRFPMLHDVALASNAASNALRHCGQAYCGMERGIV